MSYTPSYLCVCGYNGVQFCSLMENCALMERRCGLITGEAVRYCGESQEVDGIQYQNVERYLQIIALQCFNFYGMIT